MYETAVDPSIVKWLLAELTRSDDSNSTDRFGIDDLTREVHWNRLTNVRDLWSDLYDQYSTQ